MPHAMQILMCGGRRTGKTAILAAIVQNIQQKFSDGSLVLDFDNARTMDLANYRDDQKLLFLNQDQAYYYPDETLGSTEPKSYPADVFFNRRIASVPISFRDVQGEYFVSPIYRATVITEIKNSQILLIAIDTPHLMESDFEISSEVYHDVFNRPNEITECIQTAWSGNKTVPRMILFVPVKCEKYVHAHRMQEVLEKIKTGYASLINYGKSLGSDCTIAVAPCITMGGMEFLRYESLDSNAPATSLIDGIKYLNARSCYQYIVDQDSCYYFEPQDCEQPLLYCLMFFIRCLQDKQSNFIKNFFLSLGRRAPIRDILDARPSIKQNLKCDAADGYAVLHDGYQVF